MPHFSESPVVSSMFRNQPKLADEVREIIASGKLPGLEQDPVLQSSLEAFVDKKSRQGGALESSSEARSGAASLRGLEAIVRLIGRPPLLVRNGTYIVPEAPSVVIPQQTLAYIAELRRSLIDGVIACSGRVDILDVPGIPFVGTAWIVEKPKDDIAIMVTNRHVANEFSRANGLGGFTFLTAPNRRPFEAQVGFVREHLNDVVDQRQAQVTKVLYIAAETDPDVALIEVKGEHIRPLQPIELAGNIAKHKAEIGVVGYPAYDSRNDSAAIGRYFDNIYNVKRFAFGEISGVSTQFPEFTHDATTLGGNSGSCVFELSSGKAVGLHFAGDYSVANYAVGVNQIKMALAGLKTNSLVSRNGLKAISDGKKPVSFYRGRDGYNPDFLGVGAKRVALPGLGQRWLSDAAPVIDADNDKKVKELKYRHFSVVVSQSRKLPLFTAVNINGGKSKKLGRTDKWFVDGRLAEDFQVGNEAYSDNPLDRGHMVRREDPVWGTMAEAKQANIDTFHYTNCAPQHEALNQRDWLSLEDYVLANARTHKLMVSVFTGAILREDDRLYRDVVKLPEEFWKIAIVVDDDDTKKLSATGYVLTQGKLIRRVTEAFVYGAFRTYQVPISLIEEETGLDLANLLQHDPFARHRKKEGMESTSQGLFNPISSAADIIL